MLGSLEANECVGYLSAHSLLIAKSVIATTAANVPKQDHSQHRQIEDANED
jgi:hypothetical protein